ncbi:MAG: lysS2, partial [Firmicutes bacterium]|nr:lysS2 [Bacillota bacterium]
KSATECYANGTFDDGIRKMFKHMKEIMDLILPTMREENRAGWFPWLPICEQCGKVNTTRVEDYSADEATVTYACVGEHKGTTGCGHRGTQSALGGRGKFFWKADWALRWYVFGVNFEMHGKDLIDSAKLSSEIVKIIGGKPPVTMMYELFLTEEGRKISKSVGAGISMENWGRWGTQDSLNLLMFKNPKQQKKLGTDSIIQYTDETLTMTKEDAQYRFIYYHGDRPDLGGLRYSDIINLVNAISVTEPDQLIEYLGRSFGRDRITANEDFVRELLAKAISYYEDFILPTRETPVLTDEQWEMVAEFDRLIDTTDDADAIQTGVFSIAKGHGYQPKDFFQMLYGVLLGASHGPRIGGFVNLVGKGRIHELVATARK